MRHDDEINAFKQSINLSQYAASHGYILDRKSSSRNCAVMKYGGDKIIIVLNTNGHWIYFSVGDDQDNGTIIDFVQNRLRLDLGQVRKELRPWLDGISTPQHIAVENYCSELLPLSKNVGAARARFSSMSPISTSRYLEQERHIPNILIAGDRFGGKIYRDERSNMIFPHINRDGVCGYEVKNFEFTGFAPEGEKGLWCSHIKEDDTALVIGEAAIDLLSFAALHPDPKARYVSTGGQLNHTQPNLLIRAAHKLPTGSKIILAMDNDGAGEALADKITALFPPELTQERIIEVKSPLGAGDDWNDVLRASKSKIEPSLGMN